MYVHCSAHCLNLVIVDSVKSVVDARNFSLLERMYLFHSGSYVRNSWLEVQREMFVGAPREPQQLSDTCWACKQIACRNVIKRLSAIVQVLDEIAFEKTSQRAVKASHPTNLMAFTQFLDLYQYLFHEFFRLCKTAVVLPVSSASCERHFSILGL